MKILYVITSTETGGAEKALLALSGAVAAQGHQVRIICLKPLGRVAAEMQQNGLDVKSIYGRLPGRIVHRLKKEIELFRPDLVHAMLFRAIEYARMACDGKSVRLIVTPHFDLSKKPFLFRLADRLLKEKDTLAVAESMATAEYLIKHQGYHKDKVYLLPNGVDRSLFYRDNSLRVMMRNKYSFHVKTLVFICVARLAAVKDPLTLIQAFRNVWMRFPDVRLIYVGEGGERAKLEAYIRESGMQACVQLVGEQTNINAYLNMADVFVLTSIEESLPLALLEAICVGLPCIVSRVGDMPLWVEHGENGFVFPPGDITLLSCFMNEIAEDEEKRRLMGDNSLKKSSRITDNFQQYQQIYQQVLSGEFSRENNLNP